MSDEKIHDPKDFHIEEYKQLKTEITGLLARIETLARYSLVVSAGTFSWLAVQGVGVGADRKWCLKLPAELFSYAWYIPFAFSILSGLAAFAASWHIREVGSYLKTLETRLAYKGNGWGWEHNLKGKPPVLTVTGALFWFALLVATFYAGHEAVGFVEKLKETCIVAIKQP